MGPSFQHPCILIYQVPYQPVEMSTASTNELNRSCTPLVVVVVVGGTKGKPPKDGKVVELKRRCNSWKIGWLSTERCCHW